MSLVWQQSKATDSTLLVALALADWSNDDGDCWPSLRQIAEKARLTRQGVLEALARLVELGEVTKILGGHTPTDREVVRQARNLYHLQLVNNSDQSTILTSQNHPPQPVRIAPSHIRNKPSVDPSVLSSDGFDRFWEVYPFKVGKDATRRAWAKRKPDAALVEMIVTAVERQLPYLTRENGRFNLHPATWLNAGRWMDVGLPAPPPKRGSSPPAATATARDEAAHALRFCRHMPRCLTAAAHADRQTCRHVPRCPSMETHEDHDLAVDNHTVRV